MVKKEVKIDFETLAKEAIENARDDREKTIELLKDLQGYIAGGSDRHKETGFTLAKYLETLQRSNEQIAKIAALAQKDKEESEFDLSEQDREKIFDQLSNLKEDAKKSSITSKKKKNG